MKSVDIHGKFLHFQFRHKIIINRVLIMIVNVIHVIKSLTYSPLKIYFPQVLKIYVLLCCILVKIEESHVYN